MRFEDCVHLGTITKTHGVEGQLILITQTDLVSKDFREPIFIEIDGLLVPFFLSSIEDRRKDQYIISLELVDDLDEATKLIGAGVYIWKSDQALTDDFDLSQLKGITIIDQEKGEMGTCEKIEEVSGNYLLTVKHHNRELLIPFHEDFLIEFLPQENYLLLKLPEGLLNLNS